MGVETTTVNICDRCGSRHNAADYMAGNSWGQLTLKWHGDIGGRAYDGAAGGANIKGTAWICHPCTEAFLAFLKPTASSPEAEQVVEVQGCDELRLRTDGERAAYLEGIEEGKALAARQPTRIYGCCAQPEGDLHTAECPNMRHLAARQPGAQVPVVWPNGCNRTVPEALRFLASYPRPSGGEDRFNSLHLLQLAGEIEGMVSRPLYAAPPAHGIDLGPVAQDAADPSRQIHVGTLATTGAKIWHSDGKGTLWCGNTYHRTPQQLWDECHSILNDLLQMAESQRDAAPGVTS